MKGGIGGSTMGRRECSGRNRESQTRGSTWGWRAGMEDLIGRSSEGNAWD